MSRLRRRELIPDDTPISGVFKDAKLVHGHWGRQVQLDVLVQRGDYRGTQFRTWFGFGKDDGNGEEYVPYGAPLHQLLALVRPDIDEVLDAEDLSDKDYERFVKDAVKKLDGFEFMGRAGIREPKDDDDNPKKDKHGNPKRTQILQSGSFGPYEDPDEGFDDLDMSKKAS